MPVTGGFHVVVAAEEMLIALAFGTMDLIFFIIHIRRWYVSRMQGTDTQSACKQGNESFPICGGGIFLPAAAHVSYPVKDSACRCHITVVEQHERL